uniref:G_PROTEIN_RECEP_F1_2 domain-containing protein n=1 Tax=Meloidogyne hapla TaxID=6305 RepID=A0A1I8BLI7_MELHA
MCASVVYVTLKTKTLRQSYNILIVANCICGFFFMFTFLIQFIIIITGINFISLKICFPLMIIPIFFVQSQYLFYLALSIDRLITVIFPIWHLTNIQKSDRGNKLYLFFIFALITFYASFTVLTGIKSSLFDNPNK